MKEKFQGTSRMKHAQLQSLRSDFEILRMKEGESVTSYVGRTLSIVNKMMFHGEILADVATVEKILRSLSIFLTKLFVQSRNRKMLIIFHLMNYRAL